MIAPPMLNTLAQISAERMLDSLVEGSALALFAWAVLRLWPRHNAATRFLVWFSVVMGTALLPLARLAWSRPEGGAAPGALLTVPAGWAEYLAAAWMLAILFSLARFIHGFVELRRLRSACRELSRQELHPELQRILAECKRPVSLLESDEVQVPTAIGFVRPAVVLPRGMREDLTPAELTQVVLHELAHLRRYDDWTNIVLQSVKSVLCFHPAIWWMEKRLALEREMACDDAVLAETGSARAYAECLTRLAERNFLRRTAALAQAAVSRAGRTTLARVTRILDSSRPAKAPARAWALSLVGGFAVVCTAIAAHEPRLVAFQAPQMLAVNASAAAPRDAAATSLGSRHDGEAKVILAKAPAETRSEAAKPARVKARQRLVLHKPGVLQARAEVDAAPPVLLVTLVQARQFSNGVVMWRLCVWQITPQEKQKSEEQVRKSI